MQKMGLSKSWRIKKTTDVSRAQERCQVPREPVTWRLELQGKGDTGLFLGLIPSPLSGVS